MPAATPELLGAHHRLAEMDVEGSDAESARPHCDEALALAEAMRRREPDNRAWQRLHGFALLLRGKVHGIRKEWPAASKDYERSLGIHERLLAEDDGNRAYQSDLANICGLLGRSEQVGRINATIEANPAADRHPVGTQTKPALSRSPLNPSGAH